MEYGARGHQNATKLPHAGSQRCDERFCTCPAGLNGQYCKHRFRILDGDSTGIISNNLEDVKTVASWMTGSDIEVAIKRVKELELNLRKIEAEMSMLKKQVAKAMRD